MPNLSMRSSKIQTAGSPPSRRRAGAGFQFVLVVVMCLLFFWFVVKPKMAELNAQKQLNAAAQAELKDIRANKQTMKSLVETMKNSTEEVQLLDEALPIDTRVTKIHVVADSLVKAAGMTLASVNIDSNPGQVVAGDQGDLDRPFAEQRKLNTLTVSLNATGTMEQGIGLLRSLESDARIVDVDEIDVASDGSGTLSFRLKLKFYYYAPAAAALPKK